MNSIRVDCVIVTYGDRWNYVEQVVKRLNEMQDIGTIVLVNNGVSYNIAGKINQFDNIHLVNHVVNEGSAVGFYSGIVQALKESGNYIWLLDDDNLPRIDALYQLEKKVITFNSSKMVFCSFRNDRKELKDKGGQCYPKNSFFEFDVIRKITKKKFLFNSKNDELLSCETVPYGGLLLSKEIFKLINLPDKKYYLYCDDNDFTYQMKDKGFDINCVTSSIIDDLENSWYRKKKVPMFKGVFQLTEVNEFIRAYYTIRNRVYFEEKWTVSNSFMYWLNVNVYLLFVLINYMPKNKKGIRIFAFILKSIRDGKKKRLGRNQSFENSLL